MESLEKVIYLATSSDIATAAARAGSSPEVSATACMCRAACHAPHQPYLLLPTQAAWTTERSVNLGMAVAGMLKGYTTTAAKITGTLLKSVTNFALQVRMHASATSTPGWG